ncbi:MAG TPA: hypothetical protein VL945_02445 [Candidatus Saccharimonadales bacterium]|nr:hypothetical protein [Candidatus Saccharimonadales bacterium]
MDPKTAPIVFKTDQLIGLALLALLVMAVAFLVFVPKASTQNSSNNTASTAINKSALPAKILPGAFPALSCPTLYYTTDSNITGSPGFTYSNSSDGNDYVISPGHSGQINYRIKVGPAIIQNSTLNASITNTANLYYQGNPSGGNYGPTGINVTMYPVNEILSYGGVYNVSTSVSVAANATQGTYWVILSPGFCFGGPRFLLTVGSTPFSGNLTGPSTLA